ncbi:MAG: leucine-rich repeat protein, partial [Alistipes sp.]|nr:leucine-rich repeat protein [Alistipes sp.]
SKTISSTPSEQSYELPAPTPILGSIIVKSTPAMATVYIDNKQVGKTPLVQDILIGSHDITVRKEGFRDQIKNIVVSESKTTEVEFALTANQVQSASQPKTATTVGSSSTNISTNKGHVVIPNGVTEIKAEAYKGNTELKSIIIPNSVTEIQDNAFLDCKSLESITIPNSVTKIGKDAFKGCYRLKSVHISDLSAWCKIEFADILSTPLRNGTSLYLKGRLVTSLTIPTDITEIKPYAFMDCFSLTSVTIPNSVTKIGSFAFYGCRSLTSITIGNRVTSIGSYAFDGCTSLTNITIPNSVTKIGSCAFYDCNKLSKVYCTPTTPPSGYYIKDMFKNNASGRVIYVPRASVRAYKKASVWSEYTNSIVGYNF